MTDENEIIKIRNKIDDTRTHPESFYGYSSLQEDHGTGLNYKILNKNNFQDNKTYSKLIKHTYQY